MNKLFLFLFLVAIGFTSCMKNDCPDCTNPPPPLFFQIIDYETDSDLILNGTLVPDSFILYSSSIEPVSFSIVNEDGKVLVDLSELMWTIGESQHRLAVKGLIWRNG